MKTTLWVLCLLISSAAVAQAQTYDYQGNVMAGDGATETYTASLTFFGPLTNPDTGLNYLISVSGTDYKASWGCGGVDITCCCPIRHFPDAGAISSDARKLLIAFCKFDDLRRGRKIAPPQM